MKILLKVSCKKFEGKNGKFYKLSTRLSQNGQSDFYKVFFVKEVKAELEAKNVKLNRPFTLEIDEDGIGYDIENKTIYIRAGYIFNINFIQSKKEFEKKPKFSQVFESVENTQSNNDTLKF